MPVLPVMVTLLFLSLFVLILFAGKAAYFSETVIDFIMFLGIAPSPAPVGQVKPLLSFLDPVTIALNTAQPKGKHTFHILFHHQMICQSPIILICVDACKFLFLFFGINFSLEFSLSS